MLILFFFTFLSGVATIVAPCIWPLLPIILSATADGKKWKPLGIVTGIGVVFTLSTLFLSYLLTLIPFDPANLRIVSVIIISLFGVILIVPQWATVFERLMGRLTRFSGYYLHREGRGFLSGLVVGSTLGFVWSPCAGPILGTVATLAANYPLNWTIVLLTTVFVAGVVVPLYGLALLGQQVFSHLRSVTPYTGFIQQLFGIVMIVAAILLYTGYDQILKSRAVEKYPVCEVVTNPFESHPRVEEALQTLRVRIGE